MSIFCQKNRPPDGGKKEKRKKEKAQRARGLKYKGLPNNPPNPADNTKTDIVVVVVALRNIVVAKRGTAVIGIEVPRTAPQNSRSVFLRNIIIVVKPRATIRWCPFIIMMPIIKTPLPYVPMHIV